MAGVAQKRAVAAYRRRLKQDGFARFEVIAQERDKLLLRALARRLAQGDAEAERLRASLSEGVAPESTTTGGVLAWLRRSPLVGAGLDLSRPVVAERKIDL
jgi:hypothetical protein